jgi:hypothetical protein
MLEFIAGTQKPAYKKDIKDVMILAMVIIFTP